MVMVSGTYIRGEREYEVDLLDLHVLNTTKNQQNFVTQEQEISKQKPGCQKKNTSQLIPLATRVYIFSSPELKANNFELIIFVFCDSWNPLHDFIFLELLRLGTESTDSMVFCFK